MHSSLIAILAIIHAGTSQAGTLEVIDHDRQCVIWSNDNYSMAAQVTLRLLAFSMGLIVQVGTSIEIKTAINNLVDLSEVVKGNRHELNVLNVDVCGTEDGLPAAWIQVNHTGLVTFTNKNGNQACCVLDDGLKTGSWCVATENLDKTNSPSYLSTSNLSTSTLSTSTPSTSTPSTSTLSTSTAKDNPLTITAAVWVTA